MFFISFYKIALLILTVGTIYSILRMYESFIDNHNVKMSFPMNFADEREKHLNSIHIPPGLRNAYLRGGGNPLFRVPQRIHQKERPMETLHCNYPIKNEHPKKHLFFD